MTNYEKVIKGLDSHTLAYLLYRTRACPFPNENCGLCEFYNGGGSEFPVIMELCKFPKDFESILEFLESEEEDEKP